MPPIPKAKAAAPAPKQPKLTNRGPAGNLRKVTGTLIPAAPPPEKPGLTQAVAINQISSGLAPLVVPIDTLVSDPNNARLHPERNMESIRKSLTLYGQVKPIVVRRANNVVVAGNGTLQAAKELGWTEIAASFVDMNEVEAAGYGLADNRTAELAKWDFEVVARLDRLLQEAGHDTVGWSDDELEVLRAADWVPPPIEDTQFGVNGGPGGVGDPLIIGFNPDQYTVVGRAIGALRAARDMPDMSQEEALQVICEEWEQYVALAQGQTEAG